MVREADGDYVRWSDYEVLLRAVVEMAIPYEALRMDGGARKWVSPEVWNAIIMSTEKARSIVSPSSRINPEEGA